MGRVRKDAHGRFARGTAINPAALRQARVAARMTLEQAAAGIVSRQALYQVEQGQARPMRRKLEAIAARLSIPVDALLARPHDPRESAMLDLEERQRWAELELL